MVQGFRVPAAVVLAFLVGFFDRLHPVAILAPCTTPCTTETRFLDSPFTFEDFQHTLMLGKKCRLILSLLTIHL
ncbi:uncharacterized protein LACBIDRAFT_314339 [Laccaria bicolor S238N-H82]|uniref:Predicted protein n=1 Tax=Laccaria bicolor (strain S238N-H82 / ATCC MYA-4686) TaxID=486041 RepID=B0DYB9_LACBS|nr:uncharacterized protein LACBIDRAFT_314339 [Laccaria bicolor S238N-H82]EDR00360.1 predicted protein [Laccaria bicolor S238N-H82]|eukprot:XP_001888919.1 predicted protein [Laccaria bicolor S238N-H82]